MEDNLDQPFVRVRVYDGPKFVEVREGTSSLTFVEGLKAAAELKSAANHRIKKLPIRQFTAHRFCAGGDIEVNEFVATSDALLESILCSYEDAITELNNTCTEFRNLSKVNTIKLQAFIDESFIDFLLRKIALWNIRRKSRKVQRGKA